MGLFDDFLGEPPGGGDGGDASGSGGGLFDGLFGGGESAPKRRRTFQGQQFRFKGAFDTKRSARDEMQSELNKGNDARVIKLPEGERKFGKWGVYRR